MDKDLLRLVIIAAGVVVVLGLLIWGVLKSRRKRDINFYDRGDPLEHINDDLVLDTQNDDFDIVPLGSALDDESLDPISAIADIEPTEQTLDQPVEIPELIQLSIASPSEQGFDAIAVGEACHRAGLEFGSMNVFERVDEQRQVDYAVANMVEPGTFPDNDWSSFYCPGIVFYMQPKQLENPAAVFEELLQTMDYLASELDGQKLDPQRQPLSSELVTYYRDLFAAH